MITGKVWKFGENINTDLIMPAAVHFASEEEQKRAVFSANRPGWVDLVGKGDILVGGRNFGLGSSRPAARSLRNLGLSCLIADTINGLFFRNAVNFGLLALECPSISAAFEEGDEARVTVADWSIRNPRTGQVLHALPIPEALLALMQGGGIYPVLERQALIGSI